MAQREVKKRTAPARDKQAEEEAPPQSAKGEKLKAELDELLDRSRSAADLLARLSGEPKDTSNG